MPKYLSPYENYIDCRICDSPYCDGCNIYRLAVALKQGKLDWMKDDHNGIQVPDEPPNEESEPAELFPSKTWRVELNLDPGDLHNLIELFEYQLLDHLKFLLDEGELDNIDYLRSMVHIYDELCAAQAKEEA